LPRAILCLAALGDAWLKLPAVYSQRVLSALRAEWAVDQPETFIARVRSPPYVSATPDVQHLSLSGHRRAPYALLLCSDGLPDLYHARFTSRAEMAAHWARVVGAAVDAQRVVGGAALRLLRDALGGDDVRAVSQYLTVEMDNERWMDDVTILVQRL
jgi:pyruvate dehydrogenase phosphatase